MQHFSSLDLCPCGSRARYGECCQRFHSRSATAVTAEQLMRSRYSAFVCEDSLYLLDTWHLDTRPPALALPNHTWTGLDVLKCVKGGAGDEVGTVEFIAHYENHRRGGRLHETSSFERVNGEWMYLNGEV